MYSGAFGITRGCKSYAKLFRVFLPISRILVFAGASVQVRNSLRHCISKLGTLVASLLSGHGQHYNASGFGDLLRGTETAHIYVKTTFLRCQEVHLIFAFPSPKQIHQGSEPLRVIRSIWTFLVIRVP